MDYSHISIQESSEEVYSCTITETQQIILNHKYLLKTIRNEVLQQPVQSFAGNKDLIVLITQSGLSTIYLKDLKKVEPQHLLKGTFTSCSISLTHLGAVKNDGVLYVFGNLKHLGLRSNTPVALKTENLFVPRQIICGKSFTAVSTCGGSVYVYGPNGIKPIKLNQLSAFFISSLAAADDFFACLSDSGVLKAFDSFGSEVKVNLSEELWVVGIACSSKAVVFSSDSGVLGCLVYESSDKKFVRVIYEHFGKVKLYSGFKVVVFIESKEKNHSNNISILEDFQFSQHQFFPKSKHEDLIPQFTEVLEKNFLSWKAHMKSEFFIKLKNYIEYLNYFTYCFNSFTICLTKINFRLSYEVLELLQNNSVNSKLSQTFTNIYIERLGSYFYLIKLEYFKSCMKNLFENIWVLSEVHNRKHISWAFTLIFNFDYKGRKSFITYDRLLNNIKSKKEKEISLLKNSMSSPKFQKKNSLFYVKSINNSPKYNTCATERRMEYSMQLSRKLQIKAEKKLSYDFKLNNNIFAYPKAATILSTVLRSVLKRILTQTLLRQMHPSKPQLLIKKSKLISPKNQNQTNRKSLI